MLHLLDNIDKTDSNCSFADNNRFDEIYFANELTTVEVQIILTPFYHGTMIFCRLLFWIFHACTQHHQWDKNAD